MVISWGFSASVLYNYTDESENNYVDVLETIFWTVTATEGDESVSLYGSVGLEMPTDPLNYTDLSDILALTVPERETLLFSFIEEVEPNFKTSKETIVSDRLTAALQPPTKRTVTLV